MKKKEINKQLFLLSGIIVYSIFWFSDIIRGKTEILLIIPTILFIGIIMPFLKNIKQKRKSKRNFILTCDGCLSIIKKGNSMFSIDKYLFCSKCSAAYLSKNNAKYKYLSYKKAAKIKKSYVEKNH